MKLSLCYLFATQALLTCLIAPRIPFVLADSDAGGSGEDEDDDGDAGGEEGGCDLSMVSIDLDNGDCTYADDWDMPFDIDMIEHKGDNKYVEFFVRQTFKTKFPEEGLGKIWVEYIDEEGGDECFPKENVLANHLITPDKFRAMCTRDGGEKARGKIYITDSDIESSLSDPLPTYCPKSNRVERGRARKCSFTFEIDCNVECGGGGPSTRPPDEECAPSLKTPVFVDAEGEAVDGEDDDSMYYCAGFQPSTVEPVITITERNEDPTDPWVMFTVTHEFDGPGGDAYKYSNKNVDWWAVDMKDHMNCITSDSGDVLQIGDKMTYLDISSDNGVDSDLALDVFRTRCDSNGEATVTIFIKPDDMPDELKRDLPPIGNMIDGGVPMRCGLSPVDRMNNPYPVCGFQYTFSCSEECDDEPLNTRPFLPSSEDPHNQDPNTEGESMPSGMSRCTTGSSPMSQRPRPGAETPEDSDEEPEESDEEPIKPTRNGGKIFSKRRHNSSRRELSDRRNELEENRKESRQSKWLLDQCAGSRTNEQREGLRSCIRWGVGLEHETMLVHRTEDGLEEYAVNAGSVIRDMALYGRVHGLDRKMHSIAVALYHRGASYSGRRCSGVKELNYKALLASVSQDRQELTFDSAYCQISTIDSTILDVVSVNPNVAKVSEDIGPVAYPRTGMSTELGMYQKTSGKFWKCSACGSCDLKDFTGSYHVSISLPSDPEGWIAKEESLLLDKNTCANIESPNDVWTKGIEEGRFDPESSPDDIKRDQWVQAHSNFANMIQWIEPVISATFDSADGHSVCDGGFFTEGSYRTMSSGWGVQGTTDVRTLGDFGTGRHTFQGFEWLFPETGEGIPQAYKSGLMNCVDEGMGSDIRVQSSVDEDSLRANETLPAMDVGDGIEIRIFDNFPIEHFPYIYRLIAFVAEASRLHTAPHFVYGDEVWITAMQTVLNEGWNAILPKEYVSAIAEALDLPELVTEVGDNMQAFNIFSKLYHALWQVHSDGMWTNLILDDLPESMPPIRNPNRESWEIGAMNAGVSPHVLIDIMGIDNVKANATVELSGIALKPEDIECGEDLEDLVFLAETYGMVDRINYLPDGSVVSFVLKNEKYWDAGYLNSPTCKADLSGEWAQ